MSGQITESTDQIYFIQSLDNKRIKIGISRSPIKRLRALQVGSSERLNLLFYVDGWREVEKEYHKKFAHLRHCGEWFDFDPVLYECMVDLWRNRQAHRAKFMDTKCSKEIFYDFLVAMKYTWENKAEVNGVLYQYHGEYKDKTVPQLNAIVAYRRYISSLETKNQQLTDTASRLEGCFVKS